MKAKTLRPYSFVRSLPKALSFLACLLLPLATRATVITGNIVNAADSSMTAITDGTNSATFYWSENIPGSTAWVYSTFNTAVAVAAGVTDVTQITNAGSYTFTTSSLQAVGPVGDAAYNGGVGGFVILKGSANHYAVVRIDDVVGSNDTVNATWWFQESGTGDFSSFVDTNALANALKVALDAPNLTWTTGGNSNWLVETNVTEDGVSAAQSGHISNNQSTWIKTVAPTNGTVSFFWKVSSQQSGDFLSFYINDNDEDDISGEEDWFQETYPVSAGDVLMWQYAKDGSVSEGSDAGWLDEVQFVPEAPIGPVNATLDLVLTHEDDALDNAHGYYAIPEITSIDPAPVTMDVVQNSDGHIYGQVFSGDTSWDNSGSDTYPTLQDLIFACTNQPWTLTINQGNGGEQNYTFSVSISGVTTNNLGTVVSLVPALNATNVATNTPFQWSGPAGYNSTFINAFQYPSFVSYDRQNLPGNATNWPSPPTLNYGTNAVTLVYTSNNVPGITTTTPTNTGTLAAIAGWGSTGDLQILTEDPFVVGQPAPLPVLIGGSGSLPPSSSTNGFQFGFQTLAGRNHIIQMRTNLVSGTWTDVTNFIGDGNSVQLSFPITNSPGKYFRIITQ